MSRFFLSLESFEKWIESLFLGELVEYWPQPEAIGNIGTNPRIQ